MYIVVPEKVVWYTETRIAALHIRFIKYDRIAFVQRSPITRFHWVKKGSPSTAGRWIRTKNPLSQRGDKTGTCAASFICRLRAQPRPASPKPIIASVVGRGLHFWNNARRRRIFLQTTLIRLKRLPTFFDQMEICNRAAVQH